MVTKQFLIGSITIELFVIKWISKNHMLEFRLKYVSILVYVLARLSGV